MATFSFCSYQDDHVLDWIEKNHLNPEEALIQLYQEAHKQEVEDITKESRLASILVGVVAYAMENHKSVDRIYVKDAIRATAFLMNDVKYLAKYSNPTERRRTLNKEAYLMERLI